MPCPGLCREEEVLRLWCQTSSSDTKLVIMERCQVMTPDTTVSTHWKKLSGRAAEIEKMLAACGVDSP